MSGPRAFRLIQSNSGAARLQAAVSYLQRLPPDQPVNVVAFSRGAADDLARMAASARGATIGLARYSLTHVAARTAAARLAGRGVAPATSLGSEAAAARAVFDALGDRDLGYFTSVVGTPGFPRALAQTLEELRAARVTPAALATAGGPGEDLSRLLVRAERAFDESATADRASLLAAATDAVADDETLTAPLVLLDVAIGSFSEERFVGALIARARDVCATVPVHDEASQAAFERAGGVREELVDADDTDLGRLRTHLFAAHAPPPRDADGSVTFFSAPGEGRECVELVRRMLVEARRGTRFDEMAVLVRAPQRYQGLLEHALERARIPVWFERGTRRPHPAGRAFVALLACAGEGLSARRFSEYLSLGQIPAPGTDASAWAESGDEVFGRRPPDLDEAEQSGESNASDEDLDRDAIEGTLLTPRRWERLLVEASVVGGGPARWARRLDGLAAEFRRRQLEAQREDPASPRVAGLERDLQRLSNLRRFALPLITELAEWSSPERWGVWLDRLSALAPRVLRAPAHVLRVLADLRPMASVGPVGLDEVRGVLQSRLLTVTAEPPSRRYGRVFVASPMQARGRSFKVVFVPGLAERVFPQKPRQDPLLLDDRRAGIDPRLPTGDERNRQERLLLHLAAGAASERLYVSYPRIDVGEARARVPSFYALDLIRGATGRIPDHEELADTAVDAGDPTLAWPAPAEPALAIDDQEHDLSVLRALLDAPDPESVRGHAQYLLTLNQALRRAVTERWARGERRWSAFDGLIGVSDRTRAALTGQRFAARPYSLSALQRFAACPYQFLLSAVYRLQPAEQPQPIQRMDPLTRGSLVHRIQAEFLRTLRAQHALPVRPADLEAAGQALHRVIEDVAAEYQEALVPAIDRVWRDEVAAIARDLRGWLAMLAADGATWTPTHFELAFGLPQDDTRDPASVPDPVTVAERFALRGSVDLVETHQATGALRITDHKTGKNRTSPGLVIGGGAVLQPVLYSLVVEAITAAPATESRLSFCTAAGGFTERVVPLTEGNRRLGIEALEVVDRAIELGFLAPAPADGACRWCDFRPVCGPDEETRLARKPVDRLRDVIELRSRP